MDNSKRGLQGEMVGLIPAAGRASRIAPLPCSKELFPVGFRPTNEGQSFRPKVVCHYLLEKMRCAGVTKVFVVIRKGKWDLPDYLGDGELFDMQFAFLIMSLPYGPPYTVDQAYPFIQHALVLFGFPDIIFKPDDAFQRLVDRQAETSADIVIGLFPANEWQNKDIVELEDSGRVLEILSNPAGEKARFTWIIAAWTPVFTDFMHDYLMKGSRNFEEIPQLQREMTMGNVIQAAIANGLIVQSTLFADHTYLDIGTPEDLLRAVRGTW